MFTETTTYKFSTIKVNDDLWRVFSIAGLNEQVTPGYTQLNIGPRDVPTKAITVESAWLYGDANTRVVIQDMKISRPKKHAVTSQTISGSACTLPTKFYY